MEDLLSILLPLALQSITKRSQRRYGKTLNTRFFTESLEDLSQTKDDPLLLNLISISL